MTTTAMPKTIYITTLPSVNSIPQNGNFTQYYQNNLLQSKIGTKRPFSIISSSSPTPMPVSLTLQSPSPPSSTMMNNSMNQNGNVWLPATVQRTTYKYEEIDDDYEYGDDGDGDDSESQYTESDQPPRKRERLTHLSAEEKMFRRKMKNRIAAQTARDRKKALMFDLEETVRRLEEENDTLANENTKLRQNQSSLADENERLKKLITEQQQQGSTTNTKISTTTNQDETRTVSAFGPAVSINVPLPKEQAKSGWAQTWLIASALIQLLSTSCVKSSEEEKLRLQLEQLKENGSWTLEDVLSRSPPEAIEKLWSIIQSHKTTRLKPP